ncbi:helix-turn-helix domain-containing protein [Atlantibacter hermannii]|uniref:helix-turn-helix domain-containing protein n=1 Tax=Atlantibacter hermannii TaxID=565 RepID=UPI0028A1BA5F|nr:helix-turn-helix domain-containing protein [Atlantibacter hermannii]
MGHKKGNAKDTLSRMKQAYGVTSNVEFSDLTKTPISTMSNWLSRDSIPFRYVYECAQATNKDIDWLLYGEVANASFMGRGLAKTNHSESVYKKILENGGQELLQRVMSAYGFTMQKQLGDLLGLSSATISTWVRRNYFPGDVVVACALDTNVSLRWLATGIGDKYEDVETKSNILTLKSFVLSSGHLIENGAWNIDSSFIPESSINACYVKSNIHAWIVDLGNKNIANGRWLLSVDGVYDVYEVTRMPSNKIQVKLNHLDNGFVCNTSDVDTFGHVVFTIEKNQ